MANKKGSIYKKRDRKHLYEHEIALLLRICRTTWYPIRNELLILTTYNHALRASEACDLKWNNIDLVNKTIFIKRVKGGRSGCHPIDSELEYNLLIEHYQRRDPKCPYVFMAHDKHNGKMVRYTPLNYNEFCYRLGKKAEFDFKLTPHMLRHSKTTFLCEMDIPIMTVRNFVGHTKLSSTERYIHLAANKYIGINKGSIFA